jgi:hypothetical protein
MKLRSGLYGSFGAFEYISELSWNRDQSWHYKSTMVELKMVSVTTLSSRHHRGVGNR